MKTTTSWLAELLYALKTLYRNPYLSYQLGRIRRPQFFVSIIVGYLVLTIAHVAINSVILSSPLKFNIALMLDLALQMTYLQQQSFLFISAAISIPLTAVIEIIRENSQNRLPFVHLTPLFPHQIVIGLLSYSIVFITLGILLHLPITILSFLIGNVELSYIIVTTFDLLLTTLFFSIIALLIGIFCHKNLALGTFIVLILCIGNFYWHEIFMSSSVKGARSYIKNSPFWIMSKQGIHLSPLRIQALYTELDKFLSYFMLTYDDDGTIKEIDTNISRVIKYKTDNGYDTLVPLFNNVISEKSHFYPAIEYSIKDFEAATKNFEKTLIKLQSSLSEQLKFYIANYGQKSILSQNLSFPKIASLQKLYGVLNYKREKLSVGTLQLKNLILQSEALNSIILPKDKLFEYLQERARQRWYYTYKGLSEYEMKLFLQAGRETINDEELKNYLFILHTELTALELKDIEIMIDKIKKARMLFLQNDSMTTTVKLSFSQYIPILIQFAKTSVWWPKLKNSEKDIDNQINLIEEKFKELTAQITMVKLPISLLNTNFLESSLKPNEIWLSLLYGKLIKLIIILVGYIFICNSIFSHPPLYLPLSINLLLSFIFSIIFIEIGLDPDKEIFVFGIFFPFGVIPVIAHVTPIFVLFLYNTTPLSKIKVFGFWERIIVIFNPFLFITIICTLMWYHNYFILYWSLDSDYRGIQFCVWLIIYILISYEYARQWLSFKFSKANAGIAALGVTILFVVIAGFSERFAKFEIITYLAVIHVVLILVYLLSLLYQSKKVAKKS